MGRSTSIMVHVVDEESGPAAMQHGNSATILIHHHLKLLVNFLVSNVLSFTMTGSLPSSSQLHLVSPSGVRFYSTIVMAGLLSFTAMPMFYNLIISLSSLR